MRCVLGGSGIPRAGRQPDAMRFWPGNRPIRIPARADSSLSAWRGCRRTLQLSRLAPGLRPRAGAADVPTREEP